jgi:hypothetical protein
MTEQVRHQNVPLRPKTANNAARDLKNIKQSDLGDLIRGLTVHDQMQVLHSIVDAKGRPNLASKLNSQTPVTLPKEVTFGKHK